jgi:adenylate kinase
VLRSACSDTGDDEEKNEDGRSAEDSILPEFIISLEASDNFIKERIMNLPESQVSGTANSEDGR